MYCPTCFNDTLKIASSGVVKMRFNKKARNTSQLFYNIKSDTDEELLQKFRDVITDYFSWYASFQNKDPIRLVQTYSFDFICSNGCKLKVSNQLSVIGLLINKKELLALLRDEAQKFDLEIAPHILIE